MNPIQRLAKAFWGFPIETLCRSRGFVCISLGRTHIWVPTQFAHEVKTAIERITTLEVPFLSQLESSPIIIFYSAKEQMQNARLGIFSISDNYLAWHSEGIATFLIHACFQFGEQGSPNAKTAKWLREHGFADGLIEPFE